MSDHAPAPQPARPPPAPGRLEARIKAEARALGFSGVGIMPATAARTHGFYADWLAQGHGGEMAYLQRHLPLKAHPAQVMPEARSLVALSFNYHAPTPDPPEAGPDAPLRGRVSRYAWGADYHGVLKGKLRALAAAVERAAGRPITWRGFVDSGPVMEREFAARAGLGWVGKHANLIDWEQGSWLFLAELLLDLELAPDPPRLPRGTPPGPPPLPEATPRPEPLRLLESCGSCTACITACPTQAIVADKTVDATRCISYLTIELRGPIPAPLRAPMGDWVFGCDICQDVCPWNRDAPLTAEPAFQGPEDGRVERARPSLPALLALNANQFRQRFKGTPLLRPGRRGLLRNAAIALGNRLAAGEGNRAAGLEALRGALADREPLVRGAAAWALGRAGGEDAQATLREARDTEADAVVQAEIEAALEVLG